MLLKRLAVGGMAELFLAHDPELDRFVVIKRVLPHLAEDEELAAMFVQEARIASRLHHVNIVRLFEVDQIDNIAFIVMEWIEGFDFKKLIERVSQTQTKVPVGIATWVMSQLCRALDHAHTRLDENGNPLGIIHRDVSPQNIMLSYTGEVKLVDFGIAKATSWVAQSKPGVIRGKFSYLAPEQLIEGPVDSRADIFPVGTILYEAISGTNPFRRETSEAIMAAIRGDDVEPLRSVVKNVPLALSDIVAKCLARDLNERYQTAGEVAVALEHVAKELKVGRAQLADYTAGLFGNTGERTKLYVPENVHTSREELVPPEGTFATKAALDLSMSKTMPPDDQRFMLNDDDAEESTASMPSVPALAVPPGPRTGDSTANVRPLPSDTQESDPPDDGGDTAFGPPPIDLDEPRRPAAVTSRQRPFRPSSRLPAEPFHQTTEITNAKLITRRVIAIGAIGGLAGGLLIILLRLAGVL